MNRKTIQIIVAICGVIALGFLRELVFVSINELIQTSTDAKLLVALKWVLTVLFSLFYLAITYAVLRNILNSGHLAKVSVVAYALIFLVSASIMLVGASFAEAISFYTITRQLMGILQSPFILMILVAFSWIVNGTRSKSDF